MKKIKLFLCFSFICFLLVGLIVFITNEDELNGSLHGTYSYKDEVLSIDEYSNSYIYVIGIYTDNPIVGKYEFYKGEGIFIDGVLENTKFTINRKKIYIEDNGELKKFNKTSGGFWNTEGQ